MDARLVVEPRGTIRSMLEREEAEQGALCHRTGEEVKSECVFLSRSLGLECLEEWLRFVDV